MVASVATVALWVLTANNALAETQYDMNMQEARKLTELNVRLTALYAELNARYSEADKQRLRQAEKSWIKFRDDDCRYESGSVAGASAYPMIFAMCLENLTGDRIKQLHYQVNCQEGDLSCVEWKPAHR
jgi:uncharacterized protein YecT (DUF1311 family)